MLIKSKHEGYFGDGTRLYLGGGGNSTPPPDPRLVEAQVRSLGIQDDAISRIVALSEEMQPMQREALQLGMDAQRTAMAESAADREYSLERRGQLTGMQDRIISDANEFNAPGRSAELESQAISDVGMQADIGRRAMVQEQQRMGVNPNSGAALALTNQSSVMESALKASAAGKAREAARMEGYALTDRATNALAGYPTMGMSTTGATAGYGANGVTVANAGVNGLNSGNQAALSGAGQMGQNATGAYGTQASAYNAGSGDDGTMQMVGALGGAAIVAF